MARVFNAIAAMGICASLAMLGWEVQAERPNETRYNFSVVVPPADTNGDDDMDTPPRAKDHRDGNHSDPSDDDRAGRPIGQPDPNAAIPI